MATKTVSRAEFADLTARLALIEERLAELQSAPAAKKAKKAAPTEGSVKKPVSPWIAFCTRVTTLLNEEEHASAKTAVGKARLPFCSHLKGACEGEYDTLTDDAILEHALAFVAPAPKKKPVKGAAAEELAEESAEESASPPPKKPAAAAAAPPAPKKKPVKKAAPAEAEPKALDF